MAQLVAKEEIHVIREARLFSIPQIQPSFVEINMTLLGARPLVGPRQESVMGWVVNGYNIPTSFHVIVLAFAVFHRAFFLVNDFGGEIGAGEEGTISVLLTVDIRHQGEDVGGLVHVDGGIRMRTNHNHAVRRITDNDEGGAQQNLVQDHQLTALGVPQSPTHSPHKKDSEEPVSHAEGQANTVDHHQFEFGSKQRYSGNNPVLDEGKGSHRNQKADNDPLDTRLVFAQIHHQAYGGDGEQVQQVHPYGQPHQVGNQNKPTVSERLVRNPFPLEDGPENNGREEG